MSIGLEVRPEAEVLHVVASGEFTLDEAQRLFLVVLDEVDRNDTNKVLMDGRKVTGSPAMIERFLYGEFAANAVSRYLIGDVLRRTPQFAYVLHQPVLDPLRFGETVAVNRGMWIKVFDNLAEATQWLGLPRAGDT